jgi:DNA-binding transcriptional ArsR family regulator
MAPPGTVSVLGPSLAFELTWAIHGARSAELRTTHPVLGPLYESNPGLRDRVVSFWDDGLDCFVEFDVLAHHGGALEVTDFPAVRTAVEAALATLPPDLPLRSETSEARAAIYARVDALRNSEVRRGQYFELLADLASGLEPWWRAEGLPAVERVAAQTRLVLERGRDWRELIAPGCDLFTVHLPDIVERHDAGTPLMLVPCALFGKGLYLDLPGGILIGFGLGRDDLTARARTEHVAQRLRAVADPTRLAILDYLAAGPTSVGDIARAFSLAQPTVSAHVKHLREAGLIAAKRHGTRLEISVDRSATGGLADELRTLFSP